MKYSLYVVASLLLASLVLVRAFYLRPNFWSASILLSQSNGSLLILTNLALIWTGGTVYVLQRIFYGRLRPIEVEQLYEKGWVAVTETALALTIFREDVGPRFFVMFLSLMVGKVWAWIGEGRIEFMEQQPSVSRLPTIRLAASLSVSLIFDISMLSYCLETLAREPRPGMWVMYAFEYVILLIQSTSLFLRFSLDVAESAVIHRQTQIRIQERQEELRQERTRAQENADNISSAVSEGLDEVDEVNETDIDVPGWEDKGRWMFYLDLVTDFIKSLVYCGFFMVLLFFHGLPLHIMRDLYITVRSFIKRITDFIQYRNATKDMNARYPNATATELEGDNTCIICREEMLAWEEPIAGDQAAPNRRPDERQRPKKLPCGHILHFGCLRSWLERQRVCPTCRRSVLAQENATELNAIPANAGLAPQNNAARQDPLNQPGQANGQAPRAGQPINQFRVLNFGPLRVAFGRTQGPGGVQGMLQQMANRQQGQQNQPVQTQFTQESNNGVLATTPLLIHQQIVQLQAQVAQLMQRLHSENLQLDTLERLVTELVRLQSEQQTGNNIPSISHPAEIHSGHLPLQMPQAFQVPTNEQPWTTGHPDLPIGMVLPAGYTLQRLQPIESAELHTVPSSNIPLNSGSLPSGPVGTNPTNNITPSPSSVSEPSQSRNSHDSIQQRQPRPATVEDE